MQLTLHEYHIQQIEWGEKIEYINGRLIVSKESVIAHLKNCGDLNDLEVSNFEIVSPGTATRVVNIFDVMPAYSRLDEGASNYPGFIDPIQPVGNGNSARLTNFSILVLNSRQSPYNKILDKSGPGALLTPQSEHCHIAIQAEPKSTNMSQAEYYRALKKIGLRIGTYVAKEVGMMSPEKVVNYSLNPPTIKLPKVAYVFMLASHQRSERGEPILYGDDLTGFLPTILHPNEVLDGAVISPYWNLCIDTYSYQNNPVIEGLYKRHGKELDFRGVVVCAAHITRSQRERSIQMTSHLVSTILDADIAIITKVGGGIPESDLMTTVETLEKLGVCTTAIVWSHLGDGTIQDSLTAHSLSANAVVSVGVNDAWVDLSSQERVIGGETVGPFTDKKDDKPQPANAAIQIRCREISGAINQLGTSHIAMVEI
ncbi:glycine/sarcosine/betaine reductase component B subunit [Bacillus sp. Marseille-P3661]|uniref:glycine/sarcosine/betaine reductase component B subunit n=1 Tax=Bacillus sp. Marseille-P3661 TaxID=1936234 RepID=UPI0015E1742B|nr:glycine/sarcosine/betaine reductase component B subunit [Bacillus sp. Marseille-P3661]